MDRAHWLTLAEPRSLSLILQKQNSVFLPNLTAFNSSFPSAKYAQSVTSIIGFYLLDAGHNAHNTVNKGGNVVAAGIQRHGGYPLQL